MAKAGDTKPSAVECLLATIKQSSEALQQEQLVALSGVPTDEMHEALNVLLVEGRIVIMTTPSGQIAFQAAETGQVLKQEKLKGLAKDEVLIYQLIQNSGDKGIWTKDMKTASGVPHTRLPKILKTLETRNLVKSVKGVSGGNRKIYMLYELQPSEDLTGGTWYTENHLDEDFVESMRTVCRQYITRKTDVTLDEMASFIRDKKFATVALTDRDIQKIVTTLIYDGEVDEITGQDDIRHYVPNALQVPDTTPLSMIPCGHCPVMHQCKEGNDIAPSSCAYFNEWLDF